MNDRRFKQTLLHAADSRYVFCAAIKIGTTILWIRTDAAVAYVPCPMCKAKVRSPCIDADGAPKTGTHYTRRAAATKRLRRK